MNSLIYLGEIPSDRQTVSERLASRSINYLRVEPSKIVPVVHSLYSIPSYDIYKNNLHAFVRAAATGNPVLLNNPYMALESKEVLSCMPTRIPVIISFPTKQREEARDLIKATYKMEDTLAKGKPALRGELTFEEMGSLVKDHQPSTITPTSNTHVNLTNAKFVRILHRIASAFFRLQQYPSFKNGETAERLGQKVEVAIPVEDRDDVDMTEDAENQHWVTFMLAKETRYLAHANLAVPFNTYNPEISSSSSIPTESGFCLPYEVDLSLPDYRIVPAVVSRYFMGLLGDNAEDAQEMFEKLKGSWGSICRTELGFELAHIFWCIAFAIESKTQIIAVVPSSKKYAGCLVLGEGYQVDIRGRLLEPCIRSDLVIAFETLSPHDGALVKIYGNLAYTDGQGRIADREACKSIHDLRRDLLVHPPRMDKVSEIETLAMQLSFPGMEPFSPTPYNIAVVLGAIANPEADETKIPLYPKCVVEDRREYRLLSAFGSYGPSFLVPGGKLMMLDRPFEVALGKKRGGEGESRNITKIGFIMKPLDQAYADLTRVKEIKGVHNPCGSNVMGRTSSSSLIRVAETENAASIIYALRMYSGTSIAEAVAGRKKRVAEEGNTGSGSKKRRLDDEW